ncbi:hypothetical protein [Nannocystis punicea]|uniref:Uncharacterized protein n=1 Tax=Nannocystis punicea TaxID=2995304 RepID=A0ABY7GS37_9BACT|nr:hypothetical protein [Nannocystis poenicansa]WAS89758.1 hypothetical protein O0S08_26495 [Nannocystis poenicansa]
MATDHTDDRERCLCDVMSRVMMPLVMTIGWVLFLFLMAWSQCR